MGHLRFEMAHLPTGSDIIRQKVDQSILIL
jgi:hypothetical protein